MATTCVCWTFVGGRGRRGTTLLRTASTNRTCRRVIIVVVVAVFVDHHHHQQQQNINRIIINIQHWSNWDDEDNNRGTATTTHGGEGVDDVDGGFVCVYIM